MSSTTAPPTSTSEPQTSEVWVPCMVTLPSEDDGDPWQLVVLIKDPENQTAAEVPKMVPWWKVGMLSEAHPRAVWCRTGLAIPPRRVPADS